MAAQLGSTAFRFSFEWARFEPDQPGQLDQEAVNKCVASLRIHHRLEP